MSSVRSSFRATLAGAAVVFVAAASLVAGATIANAAPNAPTITSPVSDSSFTATTISVSGSLADFVDQDVTVWVDDDGSVTVGCTVSVAYFDDTFTCDAIVPGPGKYALTATSVEQADPDQIPSPVSNSVTVIVGTSDPVDITSYDGFNNEWTTMAPVISGTGPALGSVVVEIVYYNPGETTVVYCTDTEVARDGSWSCSGAPSPVFGYTYFNAYGTDVTGAPTSIGYDDSIGGDIMPPPPQTTITVGPASVDVQAVGLAGTFVLVELYSVILYEGEGYGYGESVASCSSSEPSHVVECGFGALAPGIWNLWTQQDYDSTYDAAADDYILIPETPGSFAAAVNTDRSVTFSGTGEPGFAVSVRGAGDNTVCSATVGGASTWQCTASPAVGTANYRAIQQSVGFVATPPDYFGVLGSFQGFSDYTASIPVTVPAAPAPPPAPPITITAPTPLPWVLEGYDGSPLVPGQLLSLSATGLPVGTVVVVEIHSTPRVLGSSVVGDTGAFVLDVVVPDDLEPGDHTLVAIATPPGGVDSTVAIPVTVVAPTEPVDSEAPGGESEAEGETDDSGALGGSGSEVDRGQPASPSAISDSIPTIDRILRSPILLAVSGGLALAILLLVAIPAELLNSTLASNTRRLGRWYSAIENNVDRATEWFTTVTRTRAFAAAVLVVLTSLIFGFVDPEYGFDPVSVRMTVSLAIGLFIVTYVSSWISGAIIRRVWNIETRVSLQPAALVFAVVGVVIARLLDFSPGFLIGLVIGLDLVTRVGAPHRVRAILTNIGVIVGLAVLAWVGFSIMTAMSTGEPTMVDLLVSDALIATTAEGLTAALAALLPLGFLDGHEVFRRSKLLWAASFTAVATVFALIVLPTAEGETSDVTDVGFWMLVMVIFAVVTLSLWAVLQFTGRRDSDDDELVEQPAAASR